MDQEERATVLKENITRQLETFMDWQHGRPRTTLAELESKVLEIGRSITQTMLSYGVEEEEVAWQVENKTGEVKCGDCGRVLRMSGKREKSLQTQVGEREIERRYYHCPSCGKGIFPPG